MTYSPLRPLVAAAVLAVIGTGFATSGIAADKKAPPEIPKCDKKIGTLAVTEPENKWWTALNLESPEALIKVFVSQSGCFTLVDRGKGLAAAQAERALAGGGELRGGSNIGKGQMKAADYVLVPDIVNKNANSGGRNIGGIVGGMLGGVAGARPRRVLAAVPGPQPDVDGWLQHRRTPGGLVQLSGCGWRAPHP